MKTVISFSNAFVHVIILIYAAIDLSGIFRHNRIFETTE